MLIDDFLPVYDVAERHQIEVRAPVSLVWATLHTLDLGSSKFVRWLLFLRALPRILLSRKEERGPPDLTLAGLQKAGFVLLGERPPQELLLGVVGCFWRPVGEPPVSLDVAEFRDFGRQGYAKAAWSIMLSQRADDRTQLVTETRVYCWGMRAGVGFAYIGCSSGRLAVGFAKRCYVPSNARWNGYQTLRKGALAPHLAVTPPSPAARRSRAGA